MSTWLCIPSKRPVAEAQACIDQWRKRGYLTAIWRDAGDAPVECDLMLSGEYPGYANAVNALCAEAIERDPEAMWLVTGGDDTEPDPNHTADEIARECSEHFEQSFWKAPCELLEGMPIDRARTFGVMQPTGDRWGEDKSGSAYIDRICGSPWMGREWCLRANRGTGPLWHEFHHMFVDEHLFEVAKKYGVLWQRRDLIHMHHQWQREGGKMPKFLEQVSGRQHWSRYQNLFNRMKAAGFPESEPLAMVVSA